VATAAIGHDVSVLDFLCVNQKKETLVAVLEYFTQKNPTWQSLKSVVIDITEWGGLESVLLCAKIRDARTRCEREHAGTDTVLLDQVMPCQFHTLSYLRRMMGGAKNIIHLAHRDEIERLVYEMLYAAMKTRYCEARDVFKTRVKKIAQPFVKYFTDNWDSCSTMKANFGRRKCFSDGNTTSNQIEASWNQLKQLLGMKSSIDKCVRVVIQQQICVMCQLQLTLSHHDATPPSVAHLPRQIQPLARVLSDNCLRLVLHQWDLHAMHRARWT
jgi:hypothetical protein